jgi:serine/threonine-protein kinase
MGEVYRATDTKLKRSVAIKVLPESVSADAERLARFQREAEVLASLNHPNIAAIYGFEDAGRVRALVLELVEGPTLADRIAQGALPVDETLAIANQIAAALEAAHEQGIIHRDLKPANVKVRPDGTVKLLDFGLAKLNDPNANASNLSHGPNDPNVLSMSPTLASPAMMTGVGIIMGTAAYMSPEQARGRVVDARADIWAFGVVLYEMLSGRRAFDGEDATEVLGAVVRLDPDMDALPAHVPVRIRQVIRACLQKNVKQRLAHVQDVRLALDGAFESSADHPAAATAMVAAPPLWRRALPLVVTAVAVAAIAASAAWTLRPQDPRAVSRSVHVLPQGRNFLNTQMNVLAIDDDGRQFLYTGTGGLFVRRLDAVEDRQIPGTGAVSARIFSPFFSPDGRSVGYFDVSDQSLRRMSIDGGESLRLASVRTPLAANWHGDGTILYGQPDGVWEVSENGGDARRVIATKSGEQAFGPRRLPGSDWVLFTLIRRAGDTGATIQSDVVVQSPSGGQRVLKAGAGDARYLPTGHLVYLQEAVLYAVPFDVRRLEETGAPVPVVQGVLRANMLVGTGAGFYDISTRGTLVYVPGALTGSASSTLAWVDSSGRRQRIDLQPGVYQHPRLSPDGKWLAVERQDGGTPDIWLYETSGTIAERRLTEGGINRYPVWSRDGAYVVFQSAREGDRGIFRQRADGAGVPERLTMPAKGVEHVPEDWSPSEDRLAFSAVSGSSVELWMLTLSDRAAARVAMLGSTSPFNAVFSPDGKWMAYTERAKGVRTYVQSVTGSNRVQIGRDEETVHHPLWSGNRLFYFPGGNSAAVSRRISTDPTVTFGRPEPLPGDGLPLNVQPNTLLNHDVGKDGRFVTVLSGTGVITRNEIVVVQNWFEELNRLVPVH